MEAVYLDYAASTPLDPRAAEAMAAVAAMPGNPSSVHGHGRALRREVDLARERVAGLFGVAPASVVFTSGATEANATAVAGLFRAAARRHPGRRLRVLSTPLEHASVAETLAMLARDHGAAIDLLPVSEDGLVDASAVETMLGPDTALVCVMWANNVLGTLQPVEAVAARVAAAKAARTAADVPLAFVCDAVQAVSTQPVRLIEGMDALTVSSHKMYGPKGVGAMILAPGTRMDALLAGGGQESGMRAGTENAAGIAGFGRAAQVLSSCREEDAARVAGLRRLLVEGLRGIPGSAVVGDDARTLPGTVFVRLPGEGGDVQVIKLDASGVSASSGSACDAGHRRVSGALVAALGERAAARGGVRFSFGRFTTEDDIRRAVDAAARGTR